MDTRERRQLRKLARHMSDTGDMEQFALARGCLELLDYLDVLLQREESPPHPAEVAEVVEMAEATTTPAPEPDLVPVTCWCRGEQLWQRRSV